MLFGVSGFIIIISSSRSTGIINAHLMATYFGSVSHGKCNQNIPSIFMAGGMLFGVSDDDDDDRPKPRT